MNIKNKFISEWLMLVIIFSLIILLYQIILNNDESYIASYKDNVFQSIEHIKIDTPSYPPPLLNFID